MFALWLRQVRTKNATAVDVAWAANLGIMAVVVALICAGDPWRRSAVTAAAIFHGIRLAVHLFHDRVMGHAEEDGRYRELRAKWGAAANGRFFVFYQAQSLLDVLLAIPWALAASRAESFPGLFDAVGLAIWLLGITVEATADRQLRVFRTDPANKGRVCRVGLWSLSRHPNYFGEWLMWVAYAAWAWPAAYGPFGLLAPAVMLFFILKVTGVPPTEAQSLRSRGDAYRAYQREVSVFFPWFPRRSAA